MVLRMWHRITAAAIEYKCGAAYKDIEAPHFAFFNEIFAKARIFTMVGFVFSEGTMDYI